jgi:hypothetical protein
VTASLIHAHTVHAHVGTRQRVAPLLMDLILWCSVCSCAVASESPCHEHEGVTAQGGVYARLQTLPLVCSSPWSIALLAGFFSSSVEVCCSCPDVYGYERSVKCGADCAFMQIALHRPLVCTALTH